MKIYLMMSVFLSGSQLFASNSIDLKVTSFSRMVHDTGIELCGTAKQSEGLKPLLITVKHASSTYTTLSAYDSRWCMVIKRKNYRGNIEVSVSPLTNPGIIGAMVTIPLRDDDLQVPTLE